ncbi:hypothetical protein D3C72_2179770 [compost metagenome]
MSQTLDTLNTALDVTQLQQGDDILILARHSTYTDSAALIYYEAKNGDGIINADEITFIATFNGGVPFMDNVHLVGSI